MPMVVLFRTLLVPSQIVMIGTNEESELELLSLNKPIVPVEMELSSAKPPPPINNPLLFVFTKLWKIFADASDAFNTSPFVVS